MFVHSRDLIAEARRRGQTHRRAVGIQEVHRFAGQAGFVSTNNVDAAGVRAQTFRRHARRLGWEPYHRGLWVPTGSELNPLQKIRIAVAAAGVEVLVTGRSALFLDGIIDHAPDSVELLLPASRRVAAREGICLHRTTAYDNLRYRHRKGVRLAEVPRAFADAAAHATVDELCRDLATAIRLRRCTLASVGRELAARKRFPGRLGLRQAHGLLAGELVHSGAERSARRLLRQAGFTPHHRPLAVELAGRLAAEIDIAFPRVMYGAEIDGPHHLLADVASADRARDRLLERAGWTIDRFFWSEVEAKPQWFVAQVRRRLADRP